MRAASDYLNSIRQTFFGFFDSSSTEKNNKEEISNLVTRKQSKKTSSKKTTISKPPYLQILFYLANFLAFVKSQEVPNFFLTSNNALNNITGFTGGLINHGMIQCGQVNNNDGFCWTFDSDGNLLNSTGISTTNQDDVGIVGEFANGDLLLVGRVVFSSTSIDPLIYVKRLDSDFGEKSSILIDGLSGMSKPTGALIKNDGSFFVTGNTDGQDPSQNIWLASFDSNGNLIKFQQIGESNQQEIVTKMIEEGGVNWLAGSVGDHPLICQFSNTGNFNCESANINTTQIASITKEGNRIAGVGTQQNTDGDIFFFNKESGNDFSMSIDFGGDEKGIDIVKANDGSRIILAKHNDQWLLMRITSDYNILYAKKFTFASNNNIPTNLEMDLEGNLILFGTVEGKKAAIIKINDQNEDLCDLLSLNQGNITTQPITWSPVSLTDTTYISGDPDAAIDTNNIILNRIFECFENFTIPTTTPPSTTGNTNNPTDKTPKGNSSNALGIALGIIFSFLGMGGISISAYYARKKYIEKQVKKQKKAGIEALRNDGRIGVEMTVRDVRFFEDATNPIYSFCVDRYIKEIGAKELFAQTGKLILVPKRGQQKVGPLGSGKFGEAYILQCKFDQKYYACKQVQEEISSNEAKIQNQLSNHPNLVPQYWSGTDQETQVSVMPLAAFGNAEALAGILPYSNDASLKLKIASNLASDTLNALKYMHEKIGLNHNDMKIGNILVSLKGFLISDFGTTTKSEATTPNLVPYNVLGDTRYFPPERLAARRSEGDTPYFDGEYSDLWGWAVSIIELLRGEYPFRTPTINHDREYFEKTFNEFYPKDKKDENVLIILVRKIISKEIQTLSKADEFLKKFHQPMSEAEYQKNIKQVLKNYYRYHLSQDKFNNLSQDTNLIKYASDQLKEAFFDALIGNDYDVIQSTLENIISSTGFDKKTNPKLINTFYKNINSILNLDKSYWFKYTTSNNVELKTPEEESWEKKEYYYGPSYNNFSPFNKSEKNNPGPSSNSNRIWKSGNVPGNLEDDDYVIIPSQMTNGGK